MMTGDTEVWNKHYEDMRKPSIPDIPTLFAPRQKELMHIAHNCLVITMPKSCLSDQRVTDHFSRM